MMTTANSRKPRGNSQEIYSAVNIKLFLFLRNCTFSRVRFSHPIFLVDVLQQTVRKISRTSCRRHR